MLTTDNGAGGTAILGPGVNISVNVVDLLKANGGTADTPADYEYDTQSVSFFSGQGSIPVTRTLDITAVDDIAVEPNETVNIGFADLSAGIATSQVMLMAGDVTILDVDTGQVKLTVNGLTVNEDVGTVLIDVKADVEVTGGFTVDFSLTDGTADGLGVDFGSITGSTGTLTFAGALDEVQSIVIPITDDLTVEGLEDFVITLANPTPLAAALGSLTIKPGSGAATINISDNDSPAIVSASVTTVNEAAGTALVTLTLNKAVQGGLDIDYATVAATATAGSDFTTVTGTANFTGALNETFTFTVPIVNDIVQEGTESLGIQLSNAVPGGIVSPASIATIDGSITILDDEVDANVSASITSVNESAGTATVTLTLDNAVQDGFTVDYTTADGTAQAGSDYTATNGTATFTGTANETFTFTVPITNDGMVEGTESLGILLSNVVPGGAVLATSIGTTNGSVTIVDNDGPATVTASMTTVNETTATVTLTLDKAVQGGFLVNYATADGTAMAGSDYVATSGVANFNGAAGEVISFTVPVINDSVVEGTEALAIILSNVVPGGIVPASSILTVDGSVTIVDNDGMAKVRTSITSVSEHAGTATVTLSLDKAVQGGFTVDYATADGTATTAGLDYTATSGTASFVGNVGETVSFTVAINDDTIVEDTESFNVLLSNVVPGGIVPVASIMTADGSVAIEDNDEATVSLTPVGGDTISEPDGVRQYTLALNGATSSSTDTTVRFNTTGSARRVAGLRADQVQDYAIWIDDGFGNFTDVTTTDQFTIPAGVGAVTVEIRVVDDVVVEFPEEVDLRLNGSAGNDVFAGDPQITLGSPLGGVTNILDDDSAQVIVKATNPIAAETLPDQEINNGTFEIRLVVPGSVTNDNPFGTPAPLAFDLDVGFGVSAGTAINGVDFDSIDGEVSFGIGDTRRPVSISPIDDSLPEPGESVVLTLDPNDVTTDGGGALIANVMVIAGECDESTVTILDNDNAAVPAVASVVRDGGDISRPDLWTNLAVTFDRNVDISGNALEMLNETLGVMVDLTGASFSYNSSTFTATWDFSGLSSPLPAAFYSATLNAAEITTAGSAVTLATDFLHQEYVAISGDATLDGKVDVLGDAFALISNLGATGTPLWSQGNFNANANVDVLSDAFILVGNLGENVIPQLGVTSAPTSTAFSVVSKVPTAVLAQDDQSDEQRQNADPVKSSLALAGNQPLDDLFADEDWLV